MSRSSATLKTFAIAIVVGLVIGCSAKTPSLRPSSEVISSFPAVLTIHGRGNPPLRVEIGTFEVLLLPCDSGLVAATDPTVRPLPWSIRVVRVADEHLMLSAEVNDLPKWIEIIGDDAGVSSVPVAGPPGPSCPPGS